MAPVPVVQPNPLQMHVKEVALMTMQRLDVDWSTLLLHSLLLHTPAKGVPTVGAKLPPVVGAVITAPSSAQHLKRGESLNRIYVHMCIYMMPTGLVEHLMQVCTAQVRLHSTGRSQQLK